MQIPGESIGIIADDLTGACDNALQFYVEGANTRILLDYTVATQSAATQVWVVNTDSRHLEQFDAVAAVRKSVHFLREQGRIDRFYKKIDSTLRGHLAQECLGMLDELRYKAAIIAPAYPDEGRRTVGGYQIVRGLPVGQTEIARDPLFPVRESHLPTLLGQTSDPSIVGYIPLGKVMDGAGPILYAIQEQINQGKKLIVVDACSDTDLEQLSLAINKMPSETDVLPCGSAGLAKALSKKWVVHLDRQERPNLMIERTPLLMVIGSSSKTTRQQVQYFMDKFPEYEPSGKVELVLIKPAQILGLEPVDSVIANTIQHLQDGTHVILSTSYHEESLEQTFLMAAEQQIPRERVANLASQLLARITQEVLLQKPVKMLLSGGETANMVCKTIGTRSLQVADQVETSIPLMIDEQARWIVTKSGSFGVPASLLRIFQGLRKLELPEVKSHAE